ncbi:putative membrane protein, partial [Plasmodium gaboni]
HEEKENHIQDDIIYYKYNNIVNIDNKQNELVDHTTQTQKFFNKETEIKSQIFLSRKYKSLLLQNKIKTTQHENFLKIWNDLQTYSDSNAYIKSKRKKKIQNINKKLFYIHNDKKRYILNYSTNNSDYNSYDNKEDDIIHNNIVIHQNIKQDQEIKNIKEKDKEKYNYSNFNLFNNTIKSFGKDIMSGINNFLYNNNDNIIKNYKNHALYFDLDKKHIINYFTSTMKEIKSIKMKDSLHSYEKKDQIITYFPIYKKNKILFNHCSIKKWEIFKNHPLYNYIILNYLYDKKEDMLILFCDDIIVQIKSKKKHAVIRKENIIKIEMCCIYFNMTFECDKNIIFNIKNIIKKNKNNFLGLYFDILFKNKKKKRLIKKIHKNLVKILYFLYYVFHFIYNYNKKIANMKKLKNKNLHQNINHEQTNTINSTSYKSKEHPFITIFLENQKTIFSFSSITHFYHFFINIRDLLFNKSY